jgi:hypothetical protein
MAGRNPTAKRSGATTRAMTARAEAAKSIDVKRLPSLTPFRRPTVTTQRERISSFRQCAGAHRPGLSWTPIAGSNAAPIHNYKGQAALSVFVFAAINFFTL